MNCSLQHTANGHFSQGISQLRALGPKIMGNILQRSCVTFPLALTGGMCPKSGCIHQQSELGITEAPDECSGFIPSNDPPREQPRLLTHLCTALAQENIYSVAGRAGIGGSRAVLCRLHRASTPKAALAQPHADGPAQARAHWCMHWVPITAHGPSGLEGWVAVEA